MSLPDAVAAPTGLSGVGFNALTIYPNATAVIKGGTYDARHIVALGSDIYAGAYGLFVDTDATATVCDAELIKGGADIYEGLEPGGKGAVYVASGATLNIAGGVIEGGRGFPSTERSGLGAGIFASYQGPETNNLVITGGKILGGPYPDGDRASAIFMGGPVTVDVFSGQIGNEHASEVVTLEIGYDGLLGETDGILNIYGGEWPKGSQMSANGYNGGQAFVNIFGPDLQKTAIPMPSSMGDDVEGYLCDGSYFHQQLFGDYTLTLSNDCFDYFAQPSFPVCGKSGKSGKSSKSSEGSHAP